MKMNFKTVMIKSLIPQSDFGVKQDEDVQVVGMVIAKANLRQFESQKEPGTYSELLNCIIRDAEDSMVVCFWNASANRADKTIQIGDVVRFRNPLVKISKRENFAVSSNKEIQVSENHEQQAMDPRFVKLEGMEAAAWMGGFDASQPIPLPGKKEYSIVEAKNCGLGQIISVRGVVASMTQPKQLRASFPPTMRTCSFSSSSSTFSSHDHHEGGARAFQKLGLIEPNSGAELVVTLWNVTNLPSLRMVNPGSSVVLLNGVKVGTYHGQVVLSSMDLSVVWVNPMRYRWLNQWAEASHPTILSYFSPLAPAPAASFARLIDLQESIEKMAANEMQSLARWTVGVLTRVKMGETATYKSCSECRRTIARENLECSEMDCRVKRPAIEYKWRLVVSIMDDTGKLDATILGDAAEQLLQERPSNFPMRSQEEEVIAKVLWKRFKFGLRFNLERNDVQITTIEEVDYDEYFKSLTIQ